MMNRTLNLLFCLTLTLLPLCLCAEGIVGLWKTVNENTKQPESIIAIYKYGNEYYGKIIATYDRQGNFEEYGEKRQSRAPGVQGNPYYVGLDIIWGLKKDGNHYTDGKILDPEKGKIYGAELWNDRGNLVVRGKLFIFGRNQIWPPATDADFPPDFHKPDLATLTPSIPQVR